MDRVDKESLGFSISDCLLLATGRSWRYTLGGSLGTEESVLYRFGVLYVLPIVSEGRRISTLCVLASGKGDLLFATCRSRLGLLGVAASTPISFT